MIINNIKKYLKLRSYAILNCNFSNTEEYGSYFLMMLAWGAFGLLNINGLFELFFAIVFCFALGLMLRELRLINVYPVMILSWISGQSYNEKTVMIDAAIIDIERHKSIEE
jgi:hypothetical protein